MVTKLFLPSLFGALITASVAASAPVRPVPTCGADLEPIKAIDVTEASIEQAFGDCAPVVTQPRARPVDHVVRGVREIGAEIGNETPQSPATASQLPETARETTFADAPPLTAAIAGTQTAPTPPLPPQPPVRHRLTLSRPYPMIVVFAPSKDDLKPEERDVDMRALEVMANYLKKHSDYKVVIMGHTDVTGRPRYNLWLSKQRANRIKQYLASYGVSGDRMETVGLGLSKMLEKYSWTDERQRRVDFIVRT